MINIYILLVLIIIVSVIMVCEENNLTLIIYSSVFSLIAASLYYRYKSPDLALAEVAIGSAILPLIFIVAIGRQKDFVVVNRVEADFFKPEKNGKGGRGYALLDNFCKDHELRLKVYHDFNDHRLDNLEKKNIDLIVERCPITNKYVFKGKSSSILLTCLEKLTGDINDIEVVDTSVDERVA
jgi:putative multicomponent Na+:H+ antiporter subunit B